MRHLVFPFDYGAFRQTRWEDLRFPASGIDPAGAPAPAARDTNSGALSFSGVLDNVAGGIAQMPHSWRVGSHIHPHIHLRFPTANAGFNTRWRFDYDLANPGGTFLNSPGVFSSLAAITVPNPGVGASAYHILADLGELTMAGLEESAIIIWRVWRLANSDAADNDVNACILLEFDFHYQVQKSGSTWH